MHQPRVREFHGSGRSFSATDALQVNKLTNLRHMDRQVLATRLCGLPKLWATLPLVSRSGLHFLSHGGPQWEPLAN